MPDRQSLATRAALALILVAGLVSAPQSAAADQISDIPGVPLPSQVVTGQLGGPIYDVVYRLDVPAGYVVVAGLSGTAGTDFDLYLFDSSASTVVSTVGLLTKSNGNTSAEQLSWPSRAGGTFYLDLNGATDVEGTYTLSVHIVVDPTPPTARLLVANGVTRVNTPQVTLQLVVFDDLSGVTEMSLSADGINYLPPVALQSQIPWTLSDGDGPKQVWAKVYNGIGLASAPASVSLILDTTGPAVSTVDPPENAVVTVARPLISVQFDEPIDVASWSNLGLILQASSGGIVPGEYVYYPSIRTGTFTPSADLTLGLVYLATVGDVRDIAGNRVRDAGSWTVKRLDASSVSLSASPTVVKFGDTVALSGAAALPSGESVLLQVKAPGASDFTTDQVLAPADGAFGLSFVPPSNVTYRAIYPGSPTTIDSSSKEVRILVRRGVVVLGSGPTTTRKATAGSSVTLTAKVTPGGAATVSFRLYRYDAARRTYRYAGSYGRGTDATGRASLTWKPTAGRYYWKVAVLPSPMYANNMTAAYRWSVSP